MSAEKTYIIWYAKDGEEEWVCIHALTEDEAMEKFQKAYCFSVVECREVNNADETYLAYI